MTFKQFCKQFGCSKNERRELWLYLTFLRMKKMLEAPDAR